MSKFKVGDKVMVKYGFQGDPNFPEYMWQMVENVYEISRIDEDSPRHPYILCSELCLCCSFAEEWRESVGENVENISTVLVETYPHYFKDVSHLDKIDIYRILELYEVTDPCLQHIVKKALVTGGRTAGKDFRQDLQEIFDTAKRALEMLDENNL